MVNDLTCCPKCMRMSLQRNPVTGEYLCGYWSTCSYSWQEGDEELSPQGQDRIRRAVLADEEFMAGVREGLKACTEGRMIPWSEVKKELGLGPTGED